MRTAFVHIPEVDGIYPGPTRCYRLDPKLPNPDGGPPIEYVSVCVQPGLAGHQLPEVQTFAAEARVGAPLGVTMKKLPGSQPLYFRPADPNDGWRYALIALGVTRIEGEP